jgi:hypothetical protein
MSQSRPPFPYTVRISPRAKNVRLSIGSRKGLEVIVPRGFDQVLIPDILAEKRQWILKHMDNWKRLQEMTPSRILPETIDFTGVREQWTVRYALVKERIYSIHETTKKRELELRGPERDVPAMTTLLNKWLILQGKKHLPERMRSLAREHDFPRFSGIQVRNQKARWGSCSTRGTISLNAKLLFIAPELITYIMIHELCHLVHLNHSPAFWSTVEKHMPDFRIHEERLAHAERQVPAWTGGFSF